MTSVDFLKNLQKDNGGFFKETFLNGLHRIKRGFFNDLQRVNRGFSKGLSCVNFLMKNFKGVSAWFFRRIKGPFRR